MTAITAVILGAFGLLHLLRRGDAMRIAATRTALQGLVPSLAAGALERDSWPNGSGSYRYRSVPLVFLALLSPSVGAEMLGLAQQRRRWQLKELVLARPRWDRGVMAFHQVSLMLVADSLSNQQIPTQLFVSQAQATIKSQLVRIFTTFDVDS